MLTPSIQSEGLFTIRASTIQAPIYHSIRAKILHKTYKELSIQCLHSKRILGWRCLKEPLKWGILGIHGSKELPTISLRINTLDHIISNIQCLWITTLISTVVVQTTIHSSVLIMVWIKLLGGISINSINFVYRDGGDDKTARAINQYNHNYILWFHKIKVVSWRIITIKQ